MSDVEVTYKEPATREETARTLSALAEALADGGKVELTLGHTSITVRVPGEVQCKVEVEIDKDEVEFEVELRWSTSKREHPAPTGSTDSAESAESAESTESTEATESTEPGKARGGANGDEGEDEADAGSSAPDAGQKTGDAPAGPPKRPVHRRKAGAR
jgi:amphi-Trp domain-containing protein